MYKQYWAATPEERRAKVMPFFWGTLMRDHGSIAGNRATTAASACPTATSFRIPATPRF